jgi:hypothetical protein
MNDDLDLRVIERHHDADPTYRAALRQRLAAILDGSDGVPLEESARDLAPIILAKRLPTRPRRHRGRWVASAAAVVGAAAMIVALLVVPSNGDRNAPAVQAPPRTSPPADDTVPATQLSDVDQTVPSTQPPNVDQTVPATPLPDDLPDTPQLFAEIAPGETVELPQAPIDGLGHGSAVWTGTEMIVWGGFEGDGQRTADGVAFDLADGTWRVIARAPIAGRSEAAMVWTGTEMLVWGGSIADDTATDDGAAYNPATDTWRLLPAAPVTAMGGRLTSMVWTGDEAIVVNEAAAAYDPITNTWRRLANPPSFGYPALWTGDSVVVLDGALLMRYDLAADNWSTKSVGSQAELVVIPGGDGHVIALSSATGSPVQVLDGRGDPLTELPAFPGDPSLFGKTIGAAGWWVGGEVVYWIWTGEFPYEHEQMWALNLSTQTWRQLDDAPMIEPAVVVADDMLLAWGGTGPRGAPLETGNGFAYRAGATTSD